MTSKPQLARVLVRQVLDDDAALEAGVAHQLAQRLLERALEDLGADLLVALELQRVDRPAPRAAASRRRRG